MCRYYLDDCKAVVFVVDSSDPARMPEAQKALKKVLSDERLQGVPLMVLANKKDLPNSKTIREVGTIKEGVVGTMEGFHQGELMVEQYDLSVTSLPHSSLD